MAKSVQLHPVADRALDALERDLLSEGYWARRTDIVAGILCGTSAPQAHGMIRRFVMDEAREEQEASGG